MKDNFSHLNTLLLKIFHKLHLHTLEGQAEDKVKVEMVWTCAQEGWWIYWGKSVEDGSARLEEKRKTTEKFMDVVKEDMIVVVIGLGAKGRAR